MLIISKSIATISIFLELCVFYSQTYGNYAFFFGSGCLVNDVNLILELTMFRVRRKEKNQTVVFRLREAERKKMDRSLQPPRSGKEKNRHVFYIF